MEFLSPLFSTLSSLSIEVPLYVGLSPLCMVSSSLYASALRISDRTVMLMACLVVVWGASAGAVLRLVRRRWSKGIFFYEFLGLVTVVSSTLIGVTYSLLMRDNLPEEALAKLCATTITVYAAEKLKKDSTCEDGTCRICLEETSRNDCMALACGHCFH